MNREQAHKTAVKMWQDGDLAANRVGCMTHALLHPIKFRLFLTVNFLKRNEYKKAVRCFLLSLKSFYRITLMHIGMQLLKVLSRKFYDEVVEEVNK